MSLSRWFRDYLYIPLGGNRGASAQTYRTCSSSSSRRASGTGPTGRSSSGALYHGALLIDRARHRAGATCPTDRLQALRRAVTFLLVVVGWVLFRAADIGQAVRLPAGDVLVRLRAGARGVAVAATQPGDAHAGAGAAGRAPPARLVTGPLPRPGGTRLAARGAARRRGVAAPSRRSSWPPARSAPSSTTSSDAAARSSDTCSPLLGVAFFFAPALASSRGSEPSRSRTARSRSSRASHAGSEPSTTSRSGGWTTCR